MIKFKLEDGRYMRVAPEHIEIFKQRNPNATEVGGTGNGYASSLLGSEIGIDLAKSQITREQRLDIEEDVAGLRSQILRQTKDGVYMTNEEISEGMAQRTFGGWAPHLKWMGEMFGDKTRGSKNPYEKAYLEAVEEYKQKSGDELRGITDEDLTE